MHCHNERFQNNMGSNIGKGTEKLYYEDAYMREFYGTVLSCKESGKLYDVVLDKTAFFPRKGVKARIRAFSFRRATIQALTQMALLPVIRFIAMTEE